MPLGVSEEHLALHASASRWVSTYCPPSVPRATLEADNEPRPPFWPSLIEQGWLGLHIDEAHGGEGYGLPELAVVLEELGRACAPGPFLPTVLTSALIQRHGTDEQKARWLPGLVDGTETGAVAFGTGSAPVLGAGMASLILTPVGQGADGVWGVIDAGACTVTALPSLDPTRRLARVETDLVEHPERDRLIGLTPGKVWEMVATLVSAECVGGAAWCLDTAAEYAKVREQFGRPIGQFQAVKHRCADMLLSLEQARAAAWDASRGGDEAEAALAACVAGALAPEAFASLAKDCIQVLGGIGFTWEHDAHLYLKRSMSLRALLEGAAPWHRMVAELARSGVRRSLAFDLPAEADGPREDVRAFLAETKATDRSEWTGRIADAGYLVPYWPPPWGRAAGPVEQLVIDEEFAAARVRRPHLQVGAWVLPTMIAHGTTEQQGRWIPGTLRGEISWCQMFSEPGAGSDLASLSTKAVRDESGWLISGQKVWTTLAHQADFAICLARTDPDVPKRDGITCFIVDMKTPGIDVRPLRELTGHEMFNEVFLSDVFVPDDCVVGTVHDGWRAARTTLENERVSMGSGSSFGPGVENLLSLAFGGDEPVDTALFEAIGALVAAGQSLAVLGLRTTLRALSGAEPGPESSVRKLLGVEHEQRVQEAGLALLGANGAVNEGDGAAWIAGFLGNRCLTIAGGTSEVQRNVIAERLLGLPRDVED